MSDEQYPERRQQNFELEKQVYAIDGKLGRVETKIESFTVMLDERWKSMELRIELASRQQQQAVELVTGIALEVRERQKNVDERQGDIETDVALLKATAASADARFGEVKDSITWLVRAVVGMGLTIIAAVIVAVLTR